LVLLSPRELEARKWCTCWRRGKSMKEVADVLKVYGPATVAFHK